MLRYASVILLTVTGVCWPAGDLFAQAQGFGGSMVSGQGGGGTGMGSSFGGSGSSTSGMGSSAGGTSGSGLSMMNAASLSGGFGLLGFGTANGFGSSTSGGSMYGGRTYGSVTTAGGSSMTGAGGTNRSTGSSGSSTTGAGGAAGSNTRRRSSTPTNSAAKDQQAWFEPRIEVGFQIAPQQSSAVASHVATSLGTTKAGSRFGAVRVGVDGQIAILRGAVASQNDRQLAEQIALLEPSIQSVRNELTIQRAAGPSVAR